MLLKKKSLNKKTTYSLQEYNSLIKQEYIGIWPDYCGTKFGITLFPEKNPRKYIIFDKISKKIKLCSLSEIQFCNSNREAISIAMQYIQQNGWKYINKTNVELENGDPRRYEFVWIKYRKAE